MTKNLQKINHNFQKAKIFMGILRDHIATLIVTLQYLQPTEQSAVITRLENHKKILDQYIDAPEYIHQSPTTPAKLVLDTKLVCDEYSRLIKQANNLFNHDETSLHHMSVYEQTKEKTTLRNFIPKIRSIWFILNMGVTVTEWKQITDVNKMIKHKLTDTLTLLVDNLKNSNETTKKQYQTELTPCDL